MKKAVITGFIKAALVLGFMGLTACSNINVADEEKEGNKITVTVTSPVGKSVFTVDEQTSNIRSAVTTDGNGFKTSRKYEYLYDNSLRAVEVTKPDNGKAYITYGFETNSYGRSVSGIDVNVSKKRCVSRSETMANSRNAVNQSEETIEYVYDDKNELIGIIRTDSNGNVQVKGK